ncbi:low affinity iron permease family protein [Flavisolibacter tropicus]|uniref:Membrane protein n=1 Tax=Flavisolibacter tropicus TaxID=1492898 RepID=A0A172TU71_9BACT|nr:low affinity iron permease family protein [Flavisolibacter tropicus]ANE50661.1 membrane protein [Flavisolibacter tropicus]
MTSSLNTSRKTGFSAKFETIANKVTRLAGSSYAFLIAFALILLWGITGPFFHFSDTWQLVINTSTTIVTFLMVFIIQQSQNKDSIALQLKLNELIACNEAASNRLIDVEDITQEELDTLKNFYVKLATLAKKENELFSSHSIDEAADIHNQKSQFAKNRVANRNIKPE